MRKFLFSLASSLSDLKEIGCKSVWLVYISPFFRPIEQLLAFKIVKIYPHPVTFSLRFFKSDRLLGGNLSASNCHLLSRSNPIPDQYQMNKRCSTSPDHIWEWRFRSWLAEIFFGAS